MRVLVTGASSQIGYFLIPRLLHDGHQVIAISRQIKPVWIAAHENLIWGTEEQTLTQLKPAIEAMVSAGPMAMAIDLIQRYPGLKALVVISTSSIRFKRQSSDAHESALINGIAELEQQLMSLADYQQVPCAVLRPTMVYGAGLDRNICLLAQLAIRFNRIPTHRKANGLRQPVHADDLAIACLQLLMQPHTGCWYIGGGTKLSYQQIVEAVCVELKHGKLLKLPLFALKWLLFVVKLTGKYPGVNSNMFARQQLDMGVNNKVATAAWGWQPRAFRLNQAALKPPVQPFSI